MITVYDTTLRDGTQGEQINLTVQDKLRIATLLDDFGVGMIEGGWPGSNPKDIEFFEKIRQVPLKHARIAAFGSTCRPSLSPEEDDNLNKLIAAETPVTTIFGKSWTRHVTDVLRTDYENNIRIVRESCAFLKKAGREVVFDAEHFFDGFKDDPEYAMRVLQAAIAGGASTVVLCDTNGGAMPWEVISAVRTVMGELGVAIGIHAHNDSGCAIANSMAALRVGATHVQGTMNGIGERCGNADLVPIIANAELKCKRGILPPGNLTQLTEVARLVSEISNVSPPATSPYVGRSAFAHKAGVHVSAIQRDQGSYEHVDPRAVGNDRRVLVSELSGRSNLNYKADQFGLDESETSQEVLEQIKVLESQGFAFEAAEASVELMMRRANDDYVPFFELVDFVALVEHRQRRGLLAEANIKVRIGDKEYHTAADGVGPVGALDGALRKALREVYPAIDTFRLTDYKVRILDGNRATAATTRVLIDTSDHDSTWTTVGASQNIIEASWRAIYDSFEYGLMRAYGDKRPVEAEPECDDEGLRPCEIA